MSSFQQQRQQQQQASEASDASRRSPQGHVRDVNAEDKDAHLGEAQRNRTWYTNATHDSVAFTPFSPYFSELGLADADTLPRRPYDPPVMAATNASSTTATATAAISNVTFGSPDIHPHTDHRQNHHQEGQEDNDQASCQSFDAQSMTPPPPNDRLNWPVRTIVDPHRITHDDMEAQFNTPTTWKSKSSSAFHDDPDKKGCWGRYRKCWIAAFVLLVLGIASGVALWFSLAKIAQAFMDGSQVKFQSVAIMNPQPDGFDAKIVGRISNAGPFSANTEPMLLTISYQDVVLGEMEMPTIELKTGQADIVTSSRFAIKNVDAFQNFSSVLLNDPDFVWRIQGKTSLKIMNMEIRDLIFDKEIALKGMDRFSGVEVKGFDLNGKKGEPIKTVISAAIDNRSPISIELGTATFNMQYGNGLIGQVVAKNVTLQSGMNILNLTGALLPPTTPNPTHFSELFSNYMTGQDSIVQCVGVGLNNTNIVPWLDFAVRSMKMDVTLKPPKDLDMITAISFDGMLMDFSTDTSLAPTVSAKNIFVEFKMPFDFPVSILRIRQSFDVVNKDGVVIATAIGEQSEVASNNIRADQIQSTLSPTVMRVPYEQQGAFSAFLRNIFAEKKDSFIMQGEADVIADTAVGVVFLKGIRFKKTVSVEGMQQLSFIKPDGRKSNPVINSYRVIKGTTQEILIETDITLYSASSVSVNMGDIMLDLAVNSTRIGFADLRNLTVNPGDNRIVCRSHFAPRDATEKAVGEAMLSNAVNGIATPITMRGTLNSSSNVLLQMTLGDMQLQAPFPGFEKPLVESAKLRLSPASVFNNRATTSFKIDNFLDEQFSFSSMDVNVYFRGNELAKLDVNLNGTDVFTLPGRQTGNTPFYPVQMNNALSKESLSALRTDITGDLRVDARGQISALVGRYPFRVNFVQNNLPTRITLF